MPREELVTGHQQTSVTLGFLITQVLSGGGKDVFVEPRVTQNSYKLNPFVSTPNPIISHGCYIKSMVTSTLGKESKPQATDRH